MKNKDVSMFKLIQVKLGTKAFHYFSCPHATIKLCFSQLEIHNIWNLAQSETTEWLRAESWYLLISSGRIGKTCASSNLA